MTSKDSQNSKMAVKQKIMLLGALLISLVVVYQVVDMLRGGIVTTSATKPPINSAAMHNSNAAATAVPAATTVTTPANNAAIAVPPPATVTNAAPLHVNNMGAPAINPPAAVADKPEAPQASDVFMANIFSNKDQQQYLQALNELNMLKVQRQVYDAKRAILEAQLLTLSTEHKIAKLTSIMGGNNSAHASQVLSAATTAPKAPNVATATPDNQASLPPKEVAYNVSSVAMVQNQWHATLEFKGDSFDVTVGDILMPDSSRVIAISDHGVTLQLNDVKRHLVFNLGSDPGTASVVTNSAAPNTMLPAAAAPVAPKA